MKTILAFRRKRGPKNKLYFSFSFAKHGEKYALTDEDSGEEIVVDGIGCIPFKKARTAKLFRFVRV